MKGVTNMKKKLSCRIGLARRLVALVCVTALLFSCLPVGVARQDVKVVKAVAIVDDYAALAEALKIIITFAASSAGVSNSEMLTDSEKAGITDFPSAKDYVHGSFSGNSDFCNIFSFDPVEMIKVECAIASACIAGGNIVRKSFLEKLWSTYDPAKDGWDSERWAGLSEGEKVKLVYGVSDVLLKAGILPVTPPEGDDNDDKEDTSNEYDDKGNHLNKKTGEPTVYNSDILKYAVASAPFATIYTLAKFMNEDDANKKFMEKETQDPDICDYSKGYWMAHPDVLSIKDSYVMDLNYTVAEMRLQACNLDKTEFSELDKLYPISYQKEGSTYICCAFNMDFSNNNGSSPLVYRSYIGKPSSTGYPLVFGYWVDDFYSTGTKVSLLVRDFKNYNISTPIGMKPFGEWVDYMVANKSVIKSNITAPNLISCGNYENVQKFRQYMLSGNYTLQEILDCMEDGWKSDRKKSWESIDNGGDTTKKVMDSDKGKKFKTKGTKTDEKGTQSGQEGVTFSSFVEGITTPSTGQGVDVVTGAQDLLGEQTNRETPVTYPSSSDFPDSIGNPDSEPDPDPEPNPTPVPGAGSEPTPVPGADNELENIDPDKVKTPQLLKKFPFCIPWDIVDLVTALSAEKKAPKFELPFKLNSKQSKQVNIDEKIVIDFSKYESLANICRWFFRLMFIAGLVVLTRYVIKG